MVYGVVFYENIYWPTRGSERTGSANKRFDLFQLDVILQRSTEIQSIFGMKLSPDFRLRNIAIVNVEKK